MQSNLYNFFLTLHASSGISSVGHHNSHMNVFVVYLLIQELFVDKIYFFEFLSSSEKPELDQLKVILASRSVVVQTSLDLSIGKREGKYQQGITKQPSTHVLTPFLGKYSVVL